jgi:hypothetical protein
VFHVLHLAKNLILFFKATLGGSSIESFHDHCMVKTTTKKQVGNLYPIGEGVSPTQINSIVGHNNGVNIINWHYNLGHLHIHTMHKMKKRKMITGIQNNFQHLFHKFPFYERYIVGKQHKIPFLEGNNS